MTSATMARMMATNARAFHAGPRSTPEYACPLRGVDPVLPGPRRVMRRSYSARLASSVVWGADAAVLFAASVTILLTPYRTRPSTIRMTTMLPTMAPPLR
jgi:hypothetical protein